MSWLVLSSATLLFMISFHRFLPRLLPKVSCQRECYMPAGILSGKFSNFEWRIIDYLNFVGFLNHTDMDRSFILALFEVGQ